MNKYITEFIGTFFLVLVIALTGNPIAIGSILMVMIYMGGPISGGHFNPAVSLGVFIRGKLDGKDTLFYWLSQLLGGLLGALIFLLLMTRVFAPVPAPDIPFWKSVLVEFIFTFALASVVINVATTKKAAGNNYFGLAIGFTLLAAAFAGGPISGGAFNPAVAVGPMIIDAIKGGNSITHIWIYLLGPLVGGLLAGFMFKVMNPDED